MMHLYDPSANAHAAAMADTIRSTRIEYATLCADDLRQIIADNEPNGTIRDAVSLFFDAHRYLALSTAEEMLPERDRLERVRALYP